MVRSGMHATNGFPAGGEHIHHLSMTLDFAEISETRWAGFAFFLSASHNIDALQ